jgi:pyridoxal phosphate enzyme (YggS family)
VINLDTYKKLNSLKNKINENVQLVAVSKFQSVEAIQSLYNEGHRHFGENYVQELLSKVEVLPKDICWHFIGHLQSNKVKYIAPFIHLIQGVDSLKLLKEINKEAKKNNKVINCLLQIHIAKEETKFGFNLDEVKELFNSHQLNELQHICIKGVMGMASFVEDEKQVEQEFESLYNVFSFLQKNATSNCSPSIASFGMSGDYELAIACNSNMIRVGSMLFGARKV